MKNIPIPNYSVELSCSSNKESFSRVNIKAFVRGDNACHALGKLLCSLPKGLTVHTIAVSPSL